MKKLKFSKLNLDDAHILSREELKHILGGDGYGGGYGFCTINRPCSLYIGPGDTRQGVCNMFGGGSGVYMCGCETDYGVYEPTSGTSHCVTS